MKDYSVIEKLYLSECAARQIFEANYTAIFEGMNNGDSMKLEEAVNEQLSNAEMAGFTAGFKTAMHLMMEIK